MSMSDMARFSGGNTELTAEMINTVLDAIQRQSRVEAAPPLEAVQTPEGWVLRLLGGFEEVALEVVTSAGDKIPMLVNARERRDDAGSLLFIQFAMIRARLSVASGFGNPANLPASSHGSFPSRANTEAKLRVMPFASVPTAAKRNSFSPERRKAKASELGISNS